VPPVTPLTLSSPTKATLFRITLWRCWPPSEHGIAQPNPRDLSVGQYSLIRLKIGPVCGSVPGAFLSQGILPDTTALGWSPGFPGTHSLRRTKTTLIYRPTGNLRAVQLLFGHRKIESTVRYLGIEVTTLSP
jgi:hypothetical protein